MKLPRKLAGAASRSRRSRAAAAAATTTTASTTPAPQGAELTKAQYIAAADKVCKATTDKIAAAATKLRESAEQDRHAARAAGHEVPHEDLAAGL